MLRTLWVRGVSVSGLLLILAIAPLMGGAAFQASQLPVGYWPLDEAASPSANARGVFGSGVWSAAPSNPVPNAGTPPLITYLNPSCLYFDGGDNNGNDNVDITNATQLENIQEGSFTLSAWFRPEAVPAAATNEGVYGIFMKTGWHMGLYYNRAGDGTGQFSSSAPTTLGATTTWRAAYGASGQAAGVWYHLTMTLDRSAGTLDAERIKLYVNTGAPSLGGITPNDPSYEYNQGSFKIGCAYPGGAYGGYRWAAKGRIDDVRVYNYVLSADQVAVLATGVPIPLNVVATGAPEQIILTWNAPTANSVVYTYNIVRIGPGGARTGVANGISGTTFTDTIIGTYTYEVTAVSVAESGPAVSNSATSINFPPRYNDHEEGGKDGNCACGSAASASPFWALGLGLVLLAGFLIRRGI